MDLQAKPCCVIVKNEKIVHNPNHKKHKKRSSSAITGLQLAENENKISPTCYITLCDS